MQQLRNRSLISAPWQEPQPVIVEDLVDEEYLIDGNNTDKYDFMLNQHTWLYLQNIEEGKRYTFIFKIDPANAAVERPANIYFNSLDGDCFQWNGLTGDYPSITEDGKITLYKSNGVIYGELIKPYLGNCGSDS